MIVVIVLSYFGAIFIGLLIFIAALWFVTTNDEKLAKEKDLLKKTEVKPLHIKETHNSNN